MKLTVCFFLQTSRRDALLLFAAIACHKPFDTMAVAARLLQRNCPVWLMMVLLSPTFILVSAAILVGAALSGTSPILALILNGLTAGTFVYIGGYEIPAEELGHDDHGHDDTEAGVAAKGWRPNNFTKVATYCVGVGLMFLFTAILPHAHHH